MISKAAFQLLCSLRCLGNCLSEALDKIIVDISRDFLNIITLELAHFFSDHFFSKQLLIR